MVARLATGAHGVVSRRELLAADLSERQVDRRLERGALIVEFPGVYRVGHRAPNPEARYLAAVKACGEGAVLSGLAAAWLYGLVGGRAPRPEVTTPQNRRVEGILTHRSLRLDPRETTIWKRIPITTVPRTLVDLPSLLSFDDLTKAVHQADVRYGTRPEHIESVLGPLSQRPRRRHAPRDRKRRCAHPPQRARETLSCPAREAPPAASGHQPQARCPLRRLPLARPAPDDRARLLPLSPLAPRLGAGPSARTLRPRPRR